MLEGSISLSGCLKAIQSRIRVSTVLVRIMWLVCS